MRILFWQEAFWPQVGGLATQAESLLPALRQRGHDIVVVTRQTTPELPRPDGWSDFALYRFPFWDVLHDGRPSAVLALQGEVDRLYRDFKPDVVHLSGFGPSALFVLQAQQTSQAPLLVTLHSSNTLSAKRATLFERTLARADWVSACSRAMLDAARDCVPAITQRSTVVYNGVPTPSAPPMPLPYAPSRLLSLGHLAEHKGYDLVLRAAPALIARFPTLRIVLAGDGPARATLERHAREAGIAAAVEIPGLVPRTAVADLINRATVVVVPSRRESFGLVAVEAALLERPVVATRVGGLPEIVVHDETGLLVEPDDSAALADAMAFLLDNPQMARRMGARARTRAQRLFAVGSQCDAYVELYEQIRASRGRRSSGGTSVRH